VRIFAHEYRGAIEEEVVTGRSGEPPSLRAITEVGLPRDLVVELKEDGG